MPHDEAAGEAHAEQVEHRGGDAEQHDREQFSPDDFAPLGRTAEQRFQRAAFFFAGTQIDCRIERAGQRPEQQHKRQDLRPKGDLAVAPFGQVFVEDAKRACRRSRQMALAEILFADFLAPLGQHVVDAEPRDLRRFAGRVMVEGRSRAVVVGRRFSGGRSWGRDRLRRRSVRPRYSEVGSKVDQPRGKVRRKDEHHVISLLVERVANVGRRGAAGFDSLGCCRFAGRSRRLRFCGLAGSGFGGGGRFAEVDTQQFCPLGLFAKQSGGEMMIFDQGGQARRGGQVDDQHPGRLFAEELRDLKEAHAQQGVEQQRQHRDHEEGAAVAELVADFASRG